MPQTPSTSLDIIALEQQYAAHNYHPLPVVLAKGSGVWVWDVEGEKYYDFLSAYSAVNQGHCHPRLVNVMCEQAHKLTLVSRAFYSSKLGEASEYLAHYFGYEKSLMMNSGAEANETAIKLARRWGYTVKGIPNNEAIIVVATQNFHGRTTTIISASTDPHSKDGFGPYMPGFQIIPYEDIKALEQSFQNPNVCGFLVEPIQGEAGAYVPYEGYMKDVRKLCNRYNVLLMGDEVQTGIARTGKRLCLDHEGVRADILILGKALSGGFYPISCALANDDIMLNIKPGEHGSTYGGNPMACSIVTEALKIVDDEKLIDNAHNMGIIFRDRMQKLSEKSDLVNGVRGKGLLNALLINDAISSNTAWKICLQMKTAGLLAKPTHGNIIRFSPPLIINESQINDACDRIEQSILNFHNI